MTTLVFDLEADGLNPTKVWCLVAKYTHRKDFIRFGDPEGIWKYRDQIEELFSEADRVVCHNLIDFDRVVLDKLLDINIPFHKCYDSLVISKVLNPDRELPAGYSGKSGPHSLDAWGVRVGIGKPEHEDWTQYTDEMLHRCTEDVRINEQTWFQLLREAKS